MFSILCPSRGRPHLVKKLYDSIRKTSVTEVELLVGVDSDDPELNSYKNVFSNYKNVVISVGKRSSLGNIYNRLSSIAKGDLFMVTGDDMVFLTPGWDLLIKERVKFYSDNIYCVYGCDPEDNVSEQCLFISRRSVEIMGKVGPSFLSRYVDSYLSYVFDLIKRKIRIPFSVEHCHHIYEKREHDQTDIELDARLGDDHKNYYQTESLRYADAAKLRQHIVNKLF